LRHDAEHATRATIAGAHIGAHHAGGPGIGTHEAGNNVDERGLAGAVRAKQAEKLAFFDFQADAGQRAQRAVALFNLPYFDRFQAVGRRRSTP
jgi:hypothetical protein